MITNFYKKRGTVKRKATRKRKNSEEKEYFNSVIIGNNDL